MKRRHNSGKRPVQDTRPGSGTLPCTTGSPFCRFPFAQETNSPPVSPSYNHHNMCSPLSPYRDDQPRQVLQLDKHEVETVETDIS
jgi:hypothetical protein